MKFLIVTHALHKNRGNQWYAYEPYVREMNLWLKQVDEVVIVAPLSNASVHDIEAEYQHNNISFKQIPAFNVLNVKQLFYTLVKLPVIFFIIWNNMRKADHIHLRCPGNIGLIGCLVQLFFPKKKKTVKYAGNWDPESQQPTSYKVQQYILNSSLTKNTKVLVYGAWPHVSKNILSFFTASYYKKDIIPIAPRPLTGKIKILFVGGLTKGKRPLLSLKVAHRLLQDGVDVSIDFYGDGIMRPKLEQYIHEHQLNDVVFLHGNVTKARVKEAFKSAHFLLFISKSEGWPKVVAEAMFWKCLPISSKVSCIPTMLGNGERGSVILPEVGPITKEIKMYLSNQERYIKKVNAAAQWSRQYTLDTFEEAIKQLLHEDK